MSIVQRTPWFIGGTIIALVFAAALVIESSIGNASCAQAKTIDPDSPIESTTDVDDAALSEEGISSRRDASPSAKETSPDETIVESEPDFCANVPALIQYPDMPAGCEVHSLAAVLQAFGYVADPHAIVAEHLPFQSVDGTAAGAYSGSPYVDGEGLPPAIVAAGNSFLEEAGSPLRFSDMTGTPFDELLMQAENGRPVLVWTTMYLSDPGFGAPLASYSFYPLEHCVVLLGSNDDGTVRYMDPMSGYASADAAWFDVLYELCGSMAAVIG